MGRWRLGRLAAVVTAGLLGAAPGASALDFEPAATVATSTYESYAIGLGDFDGDGAEDVVVPSLAGSVAVLLSDPDRGLVPAIGSPFPTDEAAVHNLVVGDFDGDGAPDVVTASAWTPQLAVMFGSRIQTGDLFKRGTVPIGEAPPTMAAADLDLDGDDDLLLPQISDNSLAVLLSDGDGSFTPAAPIPTGARPLGVVTADFDRDGTPDAAVTNADDGTVSILLGDGAGGFAAAPGSPVGGVGIWPRNLVAGDIDGDGDVDLAVIDIRLYRVSTLLGDGDGGFTSSGWPSFEAGWRPLAPALGNIDGDGSVDLVIGNYDRGDADLLRGGGDGTFAPALGSRVPLGGHTPALALHDFDGDGLDDIVAVDTADRSVTLWRNTSAPPLIGDAVVWGTPEPGQEVWCDLTDWSGSEPSSAEVRWLRDGVVDPGEQQEWLTVAERDRGHQLACSWTVVNELGRASATSEPVTVPLAPTPQQPEPQPQPQQPGPTPTTPQPQPSLPQPTPPVAPPAVTLPPGARTAERPPLLRIVARSLTRDRSGRVSAQVRCVATTAGSTRRCRGTLWLLAARGRTVLGRAAYSVAPGRSAVVRLSLAPAGRRALGRGRAGLQRTRLQAEQR